MTALAFWSAVAPIGRVGQAPARCGPFAVACQRAKPTVETGSPHTGYGNVALFLTLGNHVGLCGLRGGAEGIRTDGHRNLQSAVPPSFSRCESAQLIGDLPAQLLSLMARDGRFHR